MRLLMTTDTIGGVWTFTSDLGEELLSRGHAVALISFGRLPSDDQSDWVAVQRSAYPGSFEFTASKAPLEWSQENSGSMTEGEPALTGLCARFQPDILLSSQFCFGAVDINVPRVVVAHSDVLSWARACKLSALAPTPWLTQYKRLVGDGLRDADAITAPTKSALDDLLMNFEQPQQGTVIPNGRRIAPSHHPSTRKQQAVSAGRLWDEAKGLDLLRTCELPLPIFVAGETQFDDGAELPEMPKNVHLLGPLAPDKLHDLFRESAIYLCTSRYEPFGLAPLEAALCGCAIVARDLPSLHEVWGEAALYFHDASGLIEQVSRLTKDESLCAVMRERAHHRAESYTVSRMAENYLELFKTLLAKGKGAHDA